MEQLVRVTIRIQILLVFSVLLGLFGPGCFYRNPSEVFDRGQYSPVELPLTVDALKARSVAVSKLVRESKIDTSKFDIRVLQDSLSYVVDFFPTRTSYVDSTGQLWVVCARGYDVIIRKTDMRITRVWVNG